MSIQYIDLNADYTHNNKQAYVVDMSAIKQKLSRLLLTKRGSVPFNRGYGCSLYSLLFENNQAMELYQVEILLYQDITEWMPEIKIRTNSVNITQITPNSFQVDVTFTVPALNDEVGSLSQTITSK
jgi:phage baseplate assembly protein W